jgi:hypothetical protein
MTLILEGVADQHCCYRKQAEKRKSIHKILGKNSIVLPEVKLTFSITF